jgi:glycosyltransferase involved in cell wall biosynthesis
MVITHVLTSLGYGGAEITALRLAQRFDRKRFRSHVIAIRGGGPLEDEFKKIDVPVSIIGKRGRLSIPLTVLRLIREFRKVKPDLSFHYLSDAKVFGTFAARLAGVPVVVHRQPNFLIGSAWYYKRLESCMGPFVDHHIACSDSVADDTARRTSVGRSSITAIHNGVPLEPYGNLPGKKEARRSFDFPAQRFIIINVARFYLFQKAQNLLLEALRDIRRRGIDAHLVLVGEGPDRKHIERLVKKLGLEEHVSMPGTTDRVPEALAAADVFALSSDFEGFGIVVAEALAAGLPVVSTRCGGPEEILAGGKFGLLVPRRDPRSMADAIEKLAKDSIERKKFAALARERAKAFDMDSVAERYAKVFERLVRNR